MIVFVILIYPNVAQLQWIELYGVYHTLQAAKDALKSIAKDGENPSFSKDDWEMQCHFGGKPYQYEIQETIIHE